MSKSSAEMVKLSTAINYIFNKIEELPYFGTYGITRSAGVIKTIYYANRYFIISNGRFIIDEVAANALSVVFLQDEDSIYDISTLSEHEIKAFDFIMGCLPWLPNINHQFLTNTAEGITKYFPPEMNWAFMVAFDKEGAPVHYSTAWYMNEINKYKRLHSKK